MTIQQTDARLEILMQWLKDNDESDLSSREHANRSNIWVPQQTEAPKYD